MHYELRTLNPPGGSGIPSAPPSPPELFLIRSAANNQSGLQQFLQRIDWMGVAAAAYIYFVTFMVWLLLIR